MRVRLRSAGGFGMIELLISMTVLNVGILAIVAAFNSGAVSLRRASDVSTGAVLAEKQMELYRALTYAEVALDATALAATDSTYRGDAAYSATQITKTCSPMTDQCDPSRVATGPDGRSYRVDTYVVEETPTDGRALKRVTVVARKGGTLAALARVTSTFDASTG